MESHIAGLRRSDFEHELQLGDGVTPVGPRFVHVGGPRDRCINSQSVKNATVLLLCVPCEGSSAVRKTKKWIVLFVITGTPAQAIPHEDNVYADTINAGIPVMIGDELESTLVLKNDCTWARSDVIYCTLTAEGHAKKCSEKSKTNHDMNTLDAQSRNWHRTVSGVGDDIMARNGIKTNFFPSRDERKCSLRIAVLNNMQYASRVLVMFDQQALESYLSATRLPTALWYSVNQTSCFSNGITL